MLQLSRMLNAQCCLAGSPKSRACRARQLALLRHWQAVLPLGSFLGLGERTMPNFVCPFCGVCLTCSQAWLTSSDALEVASLRCTEHSPHRKIARGYWAILKIVCRIANNEVADGWAELDRHRS